jgi:restriction system protein
VDVWTVKSGKRGERDERCLEHGVIGGGWEKIPDLSVVSSREELAALCETAEPDWSPKTRSNYVAQLWSLRERMHEGELVVLTLKTSGTLAVGRVDGPYEYRDDLGDDFKHTRRVKWLASEVAKDNFDQDLLFSFGAFLTIGRVHRDKAEQRILKAIGHAQAGEDMPEDDAPEAEASIDPAQLAREQIRDRISQTIAGHDLADLVGAIFEAQGFSVSVSPPGADGGLDLLMGSGPTGLESPRIVGQVKTGQADIDVFRATVGLRETHKADQGLLVAWGGFKGTVKKEARSQHFSMLLWDSDDLIDAMFASYDQIRSDIRSKLPLQRAWVLVPTSD